MRFKRGVNISGLQPETLLGILVTQETYQRHGAELTLTSVLDGRHSKLSLHYQGYAFDCRTKTLPPGTVQLIYAELKTILDPLGFDVVLELDQKNDRNNEHLHVEFDPK